MNLGCRASLCKALSAPGMMLVIPFAMVEPSNAQTGLGGLVLEWGISGSIPQTGSTAHTSGQAFTGPRSQGGGVVSTGLRGIQDFAHKLAQSGKFVGWRAIAFELRFEPGYK